MVKKIMKEDIVGDKIERFELVYKLTHWGNPKNWSVKDKKLICEEFSEIAKGVEEQFSKLESKIEKGKRKMSFNNLRDKLGNIPSWLIKKTNLNCKVREASSKKEERKCFLCNSTEYVADYHINENDIRQICFTCRGHLGTCEEGPFETIYKTFSVECAHFIPGHPTCGKCHGHTVEISVGVMGRVNLVTGMIIDFKELKNICQRLVIDKFDHSLINDTLPLPTAELIAFYIFRKLGDEGINVSVVRVHETRDNYAEFKRR